MSKVLILLVTVLFVTFTRGQDDQLFKPTPKPFFPSSPTSTSSSSASPNGQVQFPAAPVVQGQILHEPQTRPALNDPVDPFVQKPALTSTSSNTNLPEPPQTPGIKFNKRQHEDPRFCTKIRDPVCGSNGKTYSNLCLLNQDKRSDSTLTVARQGEC